MVIWLLHFLTYYEPLSSAGLALLFTTTTASISRTQCGGRLQLCKSDEAREISTSAVVLSSVPVSDELQCARLCLRHPLCETFTFIDGECKLYEEDIYLDDTSQLYKSCHEVCLLVPE